MPQSSGTVDVYVEIGKKRTFASASEWPGWCRSSRDEASALQALFEYRFRYRQVLQAAGIEFHAPNDLAAFKLTERLAGTFATDYGTPEAIPVFDRQPLGSAELRRYQDLLKACWQAFDRIARAAGGKPLSKGPRGGGRELDAIIRHVAEAEEGYLGRIGAKPGKVPGETTSEKMERTRQVILETLVEAAKEDAPTQGPRGGIRWPPRYFIRRAAWHVLDHAWEIEDRQL